MVCRDTGGLDIDLYIDFHGYADSHSLICLLNLRLYITASENLPYSWEELKLLSLVMQLSWDKMILW